MTREEIESLASLAETNRKQFMSEANHTDVLRRIIEAADVVWAVWNDPAATYGVDVEIIKGRGRLLLISQGWLTYALKVDAVPCRDPEEAEAMRLVFGDGRAEARDWRASGEPQGRP